MLWVRRIVRTIIILGLIVLAILTHFWFLPGQWINQRSIDFILSRYFAETLSYSRESFEFKIATSQFWRRHLELHIEDLCLTTEGAAPLCLEELSFSMDLHLLNPYLIEEIKDFRLVAKELVLPQSDAKEAEETPSLVSPFERLAFVQGVISQLKWNHILIDLPRVEIPLEGGNIEVQAKLESSTPNQILSQLKIKHPSLNAEFSLDLRPNTEVGDLRLEVGGEIEPLNVALVKKILINKCHLLLSEISQDSSLKVDCPFITEIELPAQIKEKIDGLPELRVLNWQTNLDLALGQLVSQKRGEVTFGISMKPIESPFLTANLEVELKTGIDLQKPWHTWDLQPNIDFTLKTPRWQRWVHKLRGSELPVPPPFHVLDGPVVLKIQGNPVEMTREKTWRIPIKLTTDLKNKEQSLALSATAEVLIPRDIQKLEDLNLNGQLLIDRWDIPLPPINPLYGIPQVRLDQRFMPKARALTPSQMSHATLAEDISFQLPFRANLEIRSANKKSLRLFNQYVKPFVPIGLKINMDQNLQPHGKVVIAPFSLSYLRRSAHIESLELELPENQKDPIDVIGQVRVDVDIYKIYFKIKGTLEHPGLEVWSVPSLDRQDIFSLLLYNRLKSDLSDEESSQVGGTENAFADQAIGLFSLWVLASTPIQRIAYDPATQTYTARVQLGEGTTMAVGGDFEQVQALELKRRLTGNLFLTTLFRPLEDSDDQVFIEWQKRFGREPNKR